jgi:hypothetical protein
MVAITVILAAVIGAFVLEIGDQQETAPSTSFETTEQVKFYHTVPSMDKNKHNLTTVTLTHAGGDVISVDAVELKVEGNESVVGPPGGEMRYDEFEVLSQDNMVVEPMPNFCESAGTNTESSFTSGQSWYPLYHSGGNIPDPLNKKGDSDATGPVDNAYGDAEYNCGGQVLSIDHRNPDSSNPNYFRLYNDKAGNAFTELADHSNVLVAGQEITIVWSATSGGKTQTLQKYTVQRSGDYG